MKICQIICLFILLLTCNLAEASPRLFRGRVVADGKGVANVSVTDGVNVVVTDANGRYVLESDGNASFVYISTPAGYDVSKKNYAPDFYHNVSQMEGHSARLDFCLYATCDDRRHFFFVWADPQVYEQSELAFISQAGKDVCDFITSRGNIPAAGVICGDMVGYWNSEPSLFLPVMSGASESGLPFYAVVGNHDMDMDAELNEGSCNTFHSLFGPDYYSFNKGKVHYVVLNNVFFLGRDYKYVGYISEKQLRWLENDLSYVPKGSVLMVCMHIPAYSKEAQQGQYAKESISKSTCNRDALFALLEPYETHICSAHEHYAATYEIRENLIEHVHAPLSGLFWQSKWSWDGIPWGYSVYEIDGDNVSWYYKPVGQSPDMQFEAYPVGSDINMPDAFTVNVWNYDSRWKVRWYQDGICQGEMTRYTGIDYSIRKDVELRRETEFTKKYFGPIATDHLFYAIPKDKDSEIRVEVEDRFGRKCSKILKF